MLIIARKNKEFDKKQFENLCALQCTQEEICYWFDTTDKTIAKWCKRTYGLDYSECFKKFSIGGRISLRRNQFKLAQKNASMAIFLGKQYLGQTDKVEQTVFDPSGINALNESVLNNVADERTIEELE